jgi:TRAP-type C4-dicarboxylate transport system permease small subunit
VKAAGRAVGLLLAVEQAVNRASMFAACCLLAAASAVGFYQVLTRFVLSEPASWSETAVRVLLIWMAYLGLCGAMRVGALVSVDLLYKACRGRMRRALEAVITALTLALLAILVWYGTILADRVRFQNLAGLEIPVSWAYAAVPVGAAISILAVLAHFFDPKREELETAI